MALSRINSRGAFQSSEEENELQRKELRRLLDSAKDSDRKTHIERALSTLDLKDSNNSSDESKDSSITDLKSSSSKKKLQLHNTKEEGSKLSKSASVSTILNPVISTISSSPIRRRSSFLDVIPEYKEVTQDVSESNENKNDIFHYEKTIDIENIHSVVASSYDPRYPPNKLFLSTVEPTKSSWVSTGILPQFIVVTFYDTWIIKKVEVECTGVDDVHIMLEKSNRLLTMDTSNITTHNPHSSSSSSSSGYNKYGYNSRLTRTPSLSSPPLLSLHTKDHLTLNQLTINGINHDIATNSPLENTGNSVFINGVNKIGIQSHTTPRSARSTPRSSSTSSPQNPNDVGRFSNDIFLSDIMTDRATSSSAPSSPYKWKHMNASATSSSSSSSSTGGGGTSFGLTPSRYSPPYKERTRKLSDPNIIYHHHPQQHEYHATSSSSNNNHTANSSSSHNCSNGISSSSNNMAVSGSSSSSSLLYDNQYSVIIGHVPLNKVNDGKFVYPIPNQSSTSSGDSTCDAENKYGTFSTMEVLQGNMLTMTITHGSSTFIQIQHIHITGAPIHPSSSQLKVSTFVNSNAFYSSNSSSTSNSTANNTITPLTTTLSTTTSNVTMSDKNSDMSLINENLNKIPPPLENIKLQSAAILSLDED